MAQILEAIKSLNWLEILEWIKWGLSALFLLFTVLATITGNVKAKRSAEKISTFKDKLEALITEAEKYKNFSGEEKKAIVTAKISKYCLENNFKYSDSEISEAIDKAVAFTKTVNKHF